MAKPPVLFWVILALGLISFTFLTTNQFFKDEQIFLLQNNNDVLQKENEALKRALGNTSDLSIVKIGYLAPTPTDIEISPPFIEQVIQPDLNEYARKLGYNVTFEFVIASANGDSLTHLEKLQEFRAQGIELVVSGGWSSQINLSLNYLNASDMLLVGTQSTSSSLAIADDRLFRMLPSDDALPAALAGIMWSYGVKDVVIIQRGDARADGVVEVFSKAWRERGGEVEGDPVRYNPDQIDFSTYLQTANLEAQAAKAKYPEGEQVGLLLLTYDEDRSIVSQIGDYLPLYDCVTFSTNSHRNLKTPDYFAQNAQASHLRIFTPHLRPFSSSKIDELAARYPKDGAHTLRESFTYLYDAAWAIATSVLETRSTDASLVAAVFPEACSRLYGASGWCRLNQDGDRAGLPFEVWFYGTGTSSLAGVYVPDTDTMEWNMSELGYTPTGP